MVGSLERFPPLLSMTVDPGRYKTQLTCRGDITRGIVTDMQHLARHSSRPVDEQFEDCRVRLGPAGIHRIEAVVEDSGQRRLLNLV